MKIATALLIAVFAAPLPLRARRQSVVPASCRPICVGAVPLFLGSRRAVGLDTWYFKQHDLKLQLDCMRSRVARLQTVF